MGLFSFVFYKEYYYFLIYWGIDLVLYIPSLIFQNSNLNTKEDDISLSRLFSFVKFKYC